jgi:cytochrome P450
VSPVSSQAADIDFALLPPQDTEIPRFHELLRQLRESSRIAPVLFAGQPSWLVTRYRDVLDVLGDEEHFSSRALHEANSFPVMGRNLMGMEGDEHRVNKALVSPPFRRSAVSAYVEPVLRPLCHRLIDDFPADGGVDLVADFTKRFPLAVIAKLLGLPVEDEVTFGKWAMALIAFAFMPAEALDASARFNTFLGPLLAQRRADPGPDLLSTLAIAEVEGKRLSDDEALAFVRAIFAAGTDTTYNAIGSLLHAVLTHPEALDELSRRPELRPRAIEELLRWNGPIGVLPRICPADVELFGTAIPAGSTVLLGLSAANRDPDVFDDPDCFDISRDSGRHIAFGYGMHFCLGAYLARAEMSVALDVVLERLPDLRSAGDTRFVGAVIRGPDRVPVAF